MNVTEQRIQQDVAWRRYLRETIAARAKIGKVYTAVKDAPQGQFDRIMKPARLEYTTAMNAALSDFNIISNTIQAS